MNFSFHVSLSLFLWVLRSCFGLSGPQLEALYSQVMLWVCAIRATRRLLTTTVRWRGEAESN